MDKNKYQTIVKKYTPQPKRLANGLVAFIAGGAIGALSEWLLVGYIAFFSITRKEAGILVIITLIVVAALGTALGFFDHAVSKLKSALIIPITGFAHSITSAAIEYKNEGLVLGIGANIFKLGGTVILYGIVAAYFFGLIRLLIIGG